MKIDTDKVRLWKNQFFLLSNRSETLVPKIKLAKSLNFELLMAVPLPPRFWIFEILTIFGILYDHILVELQSNRLQVKCQKRVFFAKLEVYAKRGLWNLGCYEKNVTDWNLGDHYFTESLKTKYY